MQKTVLSAVHNFVVWIAIAWQLNAILFNSIELNKGKIVKAESKM